MYRFLLSWQWVTLTLLAVVLIPVMVELGFWQLHRHEARVARNDLVARSLDAPAVPVTELTEPGRDVAAKDKWRTVTAQGTYDTQHEVVVRQRLSADEQQGYFVVTPLRMDDGLSVLVNRGWVSAGNDLTTFPEVPAAPTGKITVTGRLQADETEASGIKEREGLPERQVMLINSANQRAAGMLPGKSFGGYIQLTKTTPEPSGKQPQLLPRPDSSGIGVHLAYAIQWWLFAAAVPFGWWVLVRRERREREAIAAEPAPSLAQAEAVAAD